MRKRAYWLPKFDPSLPHVVCRSRQIGRGVNLVAGQPVDFSVMSYRLARQLYEQRHIGRDAMPPPPAATPEPEPPPNVSHETPPEPPEELNPGEQLPPEGAAEGGVPTPPDAAPPQSYTAKHRGGGKWAVMKAGVVIESGLDKEIATARAAVLNGNGPDLNAL